MAWLSLACRQAAGLVGPDPFRWTVFYAATAISFAALLAQRLETQILPGFDGRILDVDVDAVVARRCAHLHAPDPRSERDALIGATAFVHSLTVVTHNVADFAPMDVAIHNPWTAQPPPTATTAQPVTAPPRAKRPQTRR